LGTITTLHHKIGKNHKKIKTGKCWGHILSQIPAKFHEISLNFEEISSDVDTIPSVGSRLVILEGF